MVRRGRNNRAMAIYLVAVLAMVLFGLGAVLSFRSAFTISSQRRVRQSLESRYIAEAALQASLHHLRHGKTSLTDSFDYAGGRASLTIAPGRGPFGEPLIDVFCKGTFQELTTALLGKVEVDPAFLKPSTGATESTSTVSSEATQPSTAPGAPGGLHVTVLKFLMTVPDEPAKPATLDEANRMFQERLQAANARFVGPLASISRADLHWQMFQLAVKELSAPSSESTTPETTGP